MIAKLLIGLACLGAVFGVNAKPFTLPDPVFLAYSTDDGLSNNNVYDLAQDQNGFMWFATNDGLNRFDGQTFTAYQSDLKDPASLPSNYITGLLVDTYGALWVGTDNGLSVLQKGEEVFETFNTSDGLSNEYITELVQVDDELWIGTDRGINVLTLANGTIKQLALDVDSDSDQSIQYMKVADKHVWVAVWGKGVFRVDKSSREVIFFDLASNMNEDPDANFITSLFVDNNNDLWVGVFQQGLAKFSVDCQCFAKQKKFELSDTWFPWDFVQQDDRLLMASNQGLTEFNLVTKKIKHFNLLLGADAGKTARDARAIAVSKDGTVWLASEVLGVVAIPPGSFTFQSYFYGQNKANRLMSDDINSLALVNEKTLWTGSIDGLYAYEYQPNGYLRLKHKLLDAHAMQISKDSVNQHYWVATDQGLFELSSSGKVINHFAEDALLTDKAKEHTSISHVYSFAQSPDQTLYAGLWLGGLVKSSIGETGFEPVHLDGENTIYNSGESVYSLLYDKGKIWVGTQNGIVLYDTENQISQRFSLQSSKNQQPIAVYQIIQGRSGMWLATTNGLYLASSNTHEFVRQKLKLNSNVIYAVTETSNDELWFSSANGLYRWAWKESQQATRYDTNHGLQGNNFNRRALLSLDDRLMFAGTNGISVVTPEQITFADERKAETTERLCWQSINSNGEVLHRLNGTEINEDIIITADISRLSLRYFVDDFKFPKEHQYRYRINRDTWIDNQNNTTINLSDLKSGTYHIELQYRNFTSKAWVNASNDLTFYVQPALYLSIYALILYSCCIFLLCFWAYRHRVNSLEKRQIFLSDLVTQRTAEMAALLKEQQVFFSNISHELKTPLTMIIGPLSQMMQASDISTIHKRTLAGVSDSASKLSLLVNQILLLAQLKQRKKNKQKVDLDELVRNVSSLMTPLATDKNVHMHIHCQTNAIVYADMQDVSSVVENLISNALKYVLQEGWIDIEASLKSNTFRMTIENAHAGLSDKQISLMFERFTRFNDDPQQEGFGLGLAFVKEICDANHWRIYGESNKRNSVKFTFELPNCSEGPAKQLIHPLAISSPESKVNKHSVLIVEDHLDIRTFLKQLLANDYVVYEAENGDKGIQIATAEVPDIIICDINMPVKNGFELVETLMTQSATNHIPIVLLSAKSSEESQIHGLALGSVDYISKPFEPQELLLKVRNIVNKQALLIARNKHLHEQANIELSSYSEKDKVFLDTAMNVVAQNYTRVDFSIVEFAEKLKMSERQLQRKLFALTRLQPAEYLRNYRLHEAKRRLRKGAIVKVVAFELGFSSSAYFGRAFKDKFKLTPKQFIQQKEKLSK